MLSPSAFVAGPQPSCVGQGRTLNPHECSPVHGADLPGTRPGSTAALGTEPQFPSAAAAAPALLFLWPSSRRGGPPTRWHHPVETRHPAGGLGMPQLPAFSTLWILQAVPLLLINKKQSFSIVEKVSNAVLELPHIFFVVFVIFNDFKIALANLSQPFCPPCHVTGETEHSYFFRSVGVHAISFRFCNNVIFSVLFLYIYYFSSSACLFLFSVLSIPRYCQFSCTRVPQ